MIDVYILFIFFAFLASIAIYFLKDQPLYLRLFPPNLAFVLITEYVAIQLAYKGQSNITLYNVLSAVETIFYLWVLSQIIMKPSIRKCLRLTVVLFPLVVVLNKYLIQKGSQYHTLTVALGSLLIVIAAIYYFYELFQSDKSVYLTREPSFWIVSGLLFFYSCSFPLFTLINVFYSPSNKTIFNLMYLSSVLNILLYSSFMVAFLCRIKIRKFFL